MRKRLLTFIAACFYYSGLVGLARWWIKQRQHSVIVLNYHCASGGDLRRHLLYLRRHYRILHLEAALEELYTPRKDFLSDQLSEARGASLVAGLDKNSDSSVVGRKTKKDRSNPCDHRIPLVLTFDDGYSDNYTHAFALARELQVPITIFLIPGYIDSGEYFWWREGKRLVCRAQVDEAAIEGHIYHLNQPGERKALVQAIDTRLRHAKSVAEREAFLATARKALAVPLAIAPEEEPTLPLTWSQVREMEESGWVSFGSHTMHHPILAYLTDPVEVQREVGECHAMLEQQLGHPVRTFAYPVGQLQHIGNNVLHAVQQAGYDWALTTMYGFNTARSNPYLLRRIEVDVSQSWLVMAAEAADLWGFFSRLRWIPAIRSYLMSSLLS
jgi:peptidoglycan/xylan/chitin deacetylase (PgdA/CDA1 family)